MTLERSQLAQKGLLIIEDDRDYCAAMHDLLRANGFVNIRIAYTGSEGLETLTTAGAEVCVILLGMRLPDMTDLDVVRRLKGCCRAPTAIIVITAWYFSDTVQEFFGLGNPLTVTMDYLAKPCSRQVVLEDIKMALEVITERRAGWVVAALEERLKAIQASAITRAAHGAANETR